MADKTTIIVQSGDMDKLYSALIVSNGSLAMGMEVSLYFTFWGLLRLKKAAWKKVRYQRCIFWGWEKDDVGTDEEK